MKKENTFNLKNVVVSILSIVIIAFLVVFLGGGKDPGEAVEHRPVVSSFTVSPLVPEQVEFCSEEISLKRLDMRERFDRELTSFTYFHSTTLLYIKRANRFFPIIEPILKKNDIPDDFKYLCVIESNLDTRALSPAKAAGLWQFMESTGKNYGLTVNSLIDDRNDVIKSTDAAARHLKDLYDIFGDWSLAISAYNCGPGNVTKAITRSGGKKTFWEIYPYLPRETRNYLPAFIAVNYAMSYYKEHSICPIEPIVSQTTDTIHITKNIHFEQIIHFTGISKEELQNFNPQYLTDIIPGSYRTCSLTLPADRIKPLLEAGDSLYLFKKESYFSKSKLNYIEDSMNNRSNFITHKIKSGETLSTIARKYHTTVKDIMKWNNLTSDKIRAGKSLSIYLK